MQTLDDEQLDGSEYVFQFFEQAVLEIYEVKDNQASSHVELPEKYWENQSLINITMKVNYASCGVSQLIFTQLRIIKLELQNLLCAYT